MRSLTNRSKLAVVCALAVAVVACVAFAAWPREPTYEGKPLGYWLDRLPPTVMTTPSSGFGKINGVTISGVTLDFSDERAFRAVDALGRSSLRVLIKRLQLPNTPMRTFGTTLRSWAISTGVFRPTPRDIFRSGYWERGQAVTALVRLGKAASPAFPDLITLTKSHPDPGVRASALEVLRQLSPNDYAQVSGQINFLTPAAH